MPILDTRPYRNKLGHVQRTPIRSVIGDVRRLRDVRAAMRDVTTVIHTAGVISFGTFPDFQAMEDVNVKGTANVIQACAEHNVPRLIYTSTVDVVIGNDDVIDADESIAIPRRFLFAGYPETKHRAETLVAEANGRMLARGDGSVMHTLILRPTVMYGEGDPWFVFAVYRQTLLSAHRTMHQHRSKYVQPWFVVSGLRAARDNSGTLVPVGDGSAKLQVTYAGNVAWAHLCAARALRVDPGLGNLNRYSIINRYTRKRPSTIDPGLSSGRSYFVTDNTPVESSFQFMKPYLASRGYALSESSLPSPTSESSVPYPAVYAFYLVADWLLWALSPIYQVNLEVSLPSVVYVNRTLTFSRQRAEETLGYQPIYDHVTSVDRSTQFYRNVKLEADR